MSETQLRQLIWLGLAGAAIYYLFFRAQASAFPESITVTPELPGLIPQFPENVTVTPRVMETVAQAQPVGFQPGWLTPGAIAMNGIPHGSMNGW